MLPVAVCESLLFRWLETIKYNINGYCFNKNKLLICNFNLWRIVYRFLIFGSLESLNRVIACNSYFEHRSSPILIDSEAGSQTSNYLSWNFWPVLQLSTENFGCEDLLFAPYFWESSLHEDKLIFEIRFLPLNDFQRITRPSEIFSFSKSTLQYKIWTGGISSILMVEKH